jgi:hypothetical protein
VLPYELADFEYGKHCPAFIESEGTVSTSQQQAITFSTFHSQFKQDVIPYFNFISTSPFSRGGQTILVQKCVTSVRHTGVYTYSTFLYFIVRKYFVLIFHYCLLLSHIFLRLSRIFI